MPIRNSTIRTLRLWTASYTATLAKGVAAPRDGACCQRQCRQLASVLLLSHLVADARMAGPDR
jgi:hypothetical protein